MKLRTLYLDEKQDKILKEMNSITVSEHIRRAIDAYIKELTKLKVSTSRS